MPPDLDQRYASAAEAFSANLRLVSSVRFSQRRDGRPTCGCVH